MSTPSSPVREMRERKREGERERKCLQGRAPGSPYLYGAHTLFTGQREREKVREIQR